MSAGFTRTWSRGKHTATAATKIDVFVPPAKGLKTKVTDIRITAPNLTTHTLTALRPLGSTTVLEDAAASQNVVKLTANPGDYTGKRTGDNVIAAGDYLVFECPDGTFWVDTANSARNGTTGAVTMSNNLPTLGLTAGAKVWFLGVAADTDPNTAEAHPNIKVPANTTTTLDLKNAALFETLHNYEPMILQENNPTTAATVEWAAGVYGR